MRIAGSSIQMSSIHEKVDIHTVDERIRMWGDVPSEARQLPSKAGEKSSETERDETRRLAGARFEAELEQISLMRRETAFSSGSVKKDTHETAEGCDKNDDDPSTWGGDIRLEVMRLIVERLSGEKVHIYKPEQADTDTESDSEQQMGESAPTAEQAAAQNQPERVGWGVEYDYKEVQAESEQTSFSSSGTIKTADGKEIAFDVSLEMSRERIDVTQLSVRKGDAKPVDPLVINFNGNAAALTESKIDFDLNADGEKESISFVRTGSGFLILDKNKDGAVNDGSELFGPSTGDGFAELRAYDDDGNGWIDEADIVYTELGVWTRTEDGQDILSSLKEADVGAVYLQSVSTPFELKNADNETDGLVRGTGVYLQETGQAGTVQQVDLMT